jgi:hypothetical protein
VILDVAEHLPERDWMLVGGQMVMLHALAADRAPTRASKDVERQCGQGDGGPARCRPLAALVLKGRCTSH